MTAAVTRAADCGYHRRDVADHSCGPADPLGREGRYYRRLLDLGMLDEPEPLLEEALQLLVELTGAREGYIELTDDDEGPLRRWSAAEGCDASRVAEIRATTSSGIIAEAIATGEVVRTASAMLDPRFGDRESVRDHAIEAVICAPLGRERPLGVVYLQGGGDALQVFAEETYGHVGYFARAVSPFLENLLARMRADDAGDREGPFAEVRYRSPAMRDVIRRLRLVAPLDVNVLFTGATGVGKTLLARAAHMASRRAGGPFVELNCAAIPEPLIENELFGAVEGAHSNVPRGGVRGKVEAAHGGTLFLDEIAEMSLGAQAKLLQLLQSGTYFRLGSPEPSTSDVRIMAATNRDLADEVRAKRVREDLYYRLNVLAVRVPSLAEREEDVTLLARHFAAEACERHGLPSMRVSPRGLAAVLHASWPGNVRQLANRLETAVLNAHLRGSLFVEPADLFEADADSDVAEEALSLQEATRQFQKRHVLSVLEATGWNLSETARRLDVVRSHVYNLIKLHGLSRAPR